AHQARGRGSAADRRGALRARDRQAHPPQPDHGEDPPAHALREARRLRSRRRGRRGDAARAAGVSGASEAERLRARVAELEAEVERLRAELEGIRRFAAQAMDAEDRARRRIAQLIHDDILPGLLAANQELSEAASGGAGAPRAHEVVSGAIERLREAMLALHPVTLER